MDKQDLIYDILVRLETKTDTRLNKIENKVDAHILSSHTISLNAKQLTALGGIITAVLGAGITVAKMIIG